MLGPPERLSRWIQSRCTLVETEFSHSRRDSSYTYGCNCLLCHESSPERAVNKSCVPCLLLVERWIAELTHDNPFTRTFLEKDSAVAPTVQLPLWVTEQESEGPLASTILTLSLITALHVIKKNVPIGERDKTSCYTQKPTVSTLLSTYFSSSKRLAYALAALVEASETENAADVVQQDSLFPSEWVTQVLNCPDLCLTSCHVTARHQSWATLSWESFYIPLTLALLHLWDNLLFPASPGSQPTTFSATEQDSPHYLFCFLSRTPQLLVQITSQLLLRAPRSFTSWLTFYCCPCRKCTPLTRNNVAHVDPPDAAHAPFIFAQLSRILFTLHETRALNALGRILLSATTPRVTSVDHQENYPLAFKDCFSNIATAVFRASLEQRWRVVYTQDALELLHAFLYADACQPQSPDVGTPRVGPWSALWTSLQQHEHIPLKKTNDSSSTVILSPYQAIFVIDALWIGVKDYFLSEAKSVNKLEATFWNKWIATSWPVEQQLRRIQTIWEHITLPLLTDLPGYGHLAVTASQIRHLLWATHLRSEKNDSNKSSTMTTILASMSYTAPHFLSTISSGLSSSVPVRACCAHALLRVVAGGLHSDSDKAEIPPLEEQEIVNMAHNVADARLPPLQQWFTAALQEGALSQLPLHDVPRDTVVHASTQQRTFVGDGCNDLGQKNLTVTLTPKQDAMETKKNQRVNKVFSKRNQDNLEVSDDQDDLYFTSCGPVSLRSTTNSPNTTTSSRPLLELNPTSKLYIVNASPEQPAAYSNLLTAVAPTSLRQCLERLRQPLKPIDRGASNTLLPNALSNDNEGQRTEESPTETYWRIRRALLTIPKIAATDFEGQDLAPKLLGCLLELQDDALMDDFQTLRVEAAVAVFVAWPTSAMSLAADATFNVNLPLVSRLGSLEVIRLAIKQLSDGKTTSSTHRGSTNRFLPIAPAVLGQLIRSFEIFHRKTPLVYETLATVNYTDDVPECIQNEPCLLLGDLLQTFTLIIELAETSTCITSMITQLAPFLDITLDSKHTHMRRSALGLLAKYPITLRSWTDFEGALGRERIPWILDVLKTLVSDDTDTSCRDMARLILDALVHLRQTL